MSGPGSIASRVRRLPAWIVMLAVVLVLTGIGAAGRGLADPGRAKVAPPQSVPVASTELVCPAPIAAGNTLTTTVAAVSAPLPGLPPGGGAAGSAGVGPLQAGPFRPERTLAALGASTGFLVTKRPAGPVLAAGTGRFAPGLGADQLTRGTWGTIRGLALQPCGPAVSSAWFMGGGSVVGRRTTLYLSNVEDQPAVVDVLLYGPRGPIDAPAGQGMVVGRGSRLVVALPSLAPGQSIVAMHVVAREGRVSPAVLDNSVSGLQARGIEYLPLTAAGRTLVLPAVLPGAGARVLELLSPRRDAQVKVTMLTSDGPITPVGLATVNLTAGKVTTVAVDKAAAGQRVGLVLRSPTPVVAGLHMVLPGAQASDTADIAGTPRLDAPAVVTALASTQSSALVLAAPGATARVRVTTYRAGAAPATPPPSTVITVPAGTTRTVPVTVPTGGYWAWLLIEPDRSGGPVCVVRSSSEAGSLGPLVTTAPVHPLSPVAQIPTALFRVGSGAG